MDSELQKVGYSDSRLHLELPVLLLPSFVSTQEVGNPRATSAPAVSGKVGAKQVEESGKRQQIKPTHCKINPLKHSDTAGAVSPSAMDEREHPQHCGCSIHWAKSCQGSTDKSQFLAPRGWKPSSCHHLLPSPATFTPWLAASYFLVHNMVSVFLKGFRGSLLDLEG